MYALLLIDTKGFEKRVAFGCLPPTYDVWIPEAPRSLGKDLDPSYDPLRISFHKTKERTFEGCHIYRERPR